MCQRPRSPTRCTCRSARWTPGCAAGAAWWRWWRRCRSRHSGRARRRPRRAPRRTARSRRSASETALSIPDPSPATRPTVIAGLLLAARAHEAAHELPFSSVDRILAATNASRSRAYEIKQAIEARMQELERPPGRPRAEPAPAPRDARAALTYEALCFLMAHPGCLQVGEQRARYSDVYRHFVLGLRERHADVTLAELAGAIALPRGTLEDWLRSPLISELGTAGQAASCDAGATQD